MWLDKFENRRPIWAICLLIPKKYFSSNLAKTQLKKQNFYFILQGLSKKFLRALCVCLSMASSLSTYHQHHLLSPSFSSKITTNGKQLSSPFFTSPSSGLSSKFNFSLRFLSNGKSSSLISPTPRRLSVVSMAPPKAKPGGKAKKGKFLILIDP